MELAPVQRRSFVRSDKRLNIWHGPVRSGKSIASLARWLDYVGRDAPAGDLFMTGRTVHALKRNILGPMEEMIGPGLRYSIPTGEGKIWGRPFHIVGANDQRSEGKIRGATAAGWYADEVSLYPADFFRMALSRMSVPGAKMFITTNPDSPAHWLKTEYIDRAHEIDAAVFHWGLRENPYLTTEFINALEREYTGLWRKRFVEGLWVLAEGAIYDMFHDEVHIRDEAPGVPSEYIVGVDYATGNPTAFILIAVQYRHKAPPIAWAESEYYYDSTKALRQKTDIEYSRDLATFIGARDFPRVMVTAVYMDPSAASFRLQCERDGIAQIRDADNDVLNGIRTVSSWMYSGRYTLMRRCVNTIREYSSYVWDPKKAARGEDAPVKTQDHCKDGERYAIHSHFGTQALLYSSDSLRR
jgi:PBSX family phage terminase large subunit